MSLFEIRKIATYTEEIHHDFGPKPEQPARKGAVMAVVTNPYVKQYVEDLSPAMDELKALGEKLGAILIEHLGGDASAIEVGVPDGPRENEMVLILAMATTGRVHARLATGFTLEDRGKPGVPA